MYRGPPTASGPFVPQGPAAAAAAAVAPVAPPQPKIDRTKTCPLLLRVYIQNDAHHSASSFAVRGEEPTEDSILIYTCTLDTGTRARLNVDRSRERMRRDCGDASPDRVCCSLASWLL